MLTSSVVWFQDNLWRELNKKPGDKAAPAQYLSNTAGCHFVLCLCSMLFSSRSNTSSSELWTDGNNSQKGQACTLTATAHSEHTMHRCPKQSLPVSNAIFEMQQQSTASSCARYTGTVTVSLFHFNTNFFYFWGAPSKAICSVGRLLCDIVSG